MGEMILKLFALTQEPQMFLSPAEVVLDAAPSPLVVGMLSHTVAHDTGDHFERLVELHETSWPLPPWGRPLLLTSKTLFPAPSPRSGAAIGFRRPVGSQGQA